MEVDDMRHDRGPDDADRQEDRALAGQRRDQAGDGQAGVGADAQQIVEEASEHDEQQEDGGDLERPVPPELETQDTERDDGRHQAGG
jgi:hypothetical protein